MICSIFPKYFEKKLFYNRLLDILKTKEISCEDDLLRLYETVEWPAVVKNRISKWAVEKWRSDSCHAAAATAATAPAAAATTAAINTGEHLPPLSCPYATDAAAAADVAAAAAAAAPPPP